MNSLVDHLGVDFLIFKTAKEGKSPLYGDS
jgi:hypothetical protein